MSFASVAATNLRCFMEIEYSPSARNNLVCGVNGSGKTSLLEAFAIASIGKSFLTNRTSELVRIGSPGLTVRAETILDEKASRSAVIVKKLKTETLITLDGIPVTAASALARHTPLLIINSKAPDLLTDSPSNRRALLDRSLFHVKQEYVATWKKYRHSLQQRNYLIRLGAKSQISFWNEKLQETAERINIDRTKAVESINTILATHRIPGLSGALKFEYFSGWHTQSELGVQLEQNWHRDVKLGYTLDGPHHADLTLRYEGRSITKRLSRGQAKVVVCLVIAALGNFMKSEIGRPPVVLVDDLAAELDDNMRHYAVEILNLLEGQCIYTAIRPSDLPHLTANTIDVFHVKR